MQWGRMRSYLLTPTPAHQPDAFSGPIPGELADTSA